MNGKGSRRRRAQVTPEEIQENWERTFGDDRSSMSLRRQLSADLGSYSDRNDGFMRSYFSSSKIKHSRIRKHGKPDRAQPRFECINGNCRHCKERR